MFAGSQVDERMLGAVAHARKAGIRTGLVSNSWGTRRYDRVLLADLFDGIVISGEVGMRKPTPQMYEIGAQRIGLEPSECVFVDDLPFNLPPAGRAGDGHGAPYRSGRDDPGARTAAPGEAGLSAHYRSDRASANASSSVCAPSIRTVSGPCSQVSASPAPLVRAAIP